MGFYVFEQDFGGMLGYVVGDFVVYFDVGVVQGQVQVFVVDFMQYQLQFVVFQVYQVVEYEYQVLDVFGQWCVDVCDFVENCLVLVVVYEVEDVGGVLDVVDVG